jgi:hypothetical protein
MQRVSAYAISSTLIAMFVPFGAPATAGDLDEFIHSARTPADYVLSKLESHRVVLFGESHWVANEVELVAGIVPRLPNVGARTLAVEVFPAAMQERLDEVVNGNAWDEAGAVAVLRAAEMPHVEYLEIIRAAWLTNRENGPGTLALVAMGPGPDWRKTLPEGEDYETFMADRIRHALNRRGGSLLAYLGLHHAFSRYVQPESTTDGRAWRFMVRSGNLLWWEMGEALFVIGTHRPFQCWNEEAWDYCVPFNGVIDCASDRAGRGAFGFDTARSPFAELRFDSRVIYAGGYPDLRLVDFVDGWVWLGPIDELRQTRLIPLKEYAPDEESLAVVRGANPFDGKELAQEDLERLWAEQTGSRERSILESRWKGVLDWREACETRIPTSTSP